MTLAESWLVTQLAPTNGWQHQQHGEGARTSSRSGIPRCSLHWRHFVPNNGPRRGVEDDIHIERISPCADPFFALAWPARLLEVAL